MLLCQSTLGWEFAVVMILGILLALGIIAAFFDMRTRRLAAAERALRAAKEAGNGDFGAAFGELSPDLAALAADAVGFDAHPAWVMPESVCVQTRPIHGVLGMLAAVLTCIAVAALPLAGTGDTHNADINRMLLSVFGGVTAAVVWVIGYVCRRRAHAVYEKFCFAFAAVLRAADRAAENECNAHSEHGERAGVSVMSEPPVGNSAAKTRESTAAPSAASTPSLEATSESTLAANDALTAALDKDERIEAADDYSEENGSGTPETAAVNPIPAADVSREDTDEVRAVCELVAALNESSLLEERRAAALRLQQARMHKHSPEEDAALHAAVVKMLELL